MTAFKNTGTHDLPYTWRTGAKANVLLRSQSKFLLHAATAARRPSVSLGC